MPAEFWFALHVFPCLLITKLPTLPHVHLLSTFRASTLSQSHRVQVRRSLVRPLQCEVFLPLRLGRNSVKRCRSGRARRIHNPSSADHTIKKDPADFPLPQSASVVDGRKDRKSRICRLDLVDCTWPHVHGYDHHADCSAYAAVLIKNSCCSRRMCYTLRGIRIASNGVDYDFAFWATSVCRNLLVRAYPLGILWQRYS